MANAAVATAEPNMRPRVLTSIATREAALGWAVVTLGIVLRVARFLNDRSLWGDEARLALNIRDKSVTGLLHPLDYVQAAPSGFLLLEKGAIHLLGDGEYALRLVPLMAGIASLALFLPLARNLLPRPAAAAAVALYALVEPLIYYSSEVKQYSLDALATVLILLIAARPISQRALSGRRAMALTLACLVVVWFSHPSIFVVAAVWLTLFFARVRIPGPRHLVVLAMGAGWLASFAASYVLVRRNAVGVSNALQLGAGTASATPAGVLRNGWHALSYPVGFAYTATALAATLACVGAYSLFRAKPWLFAPLCLTIVVAVFGGFAGRYPFYDRFLLFLVPIVLLCVAAGLDVLRQSGSTARAMALVGFAFLVAYPAGEALAHLKSPPAHEEIKPVLEHIADAWRPGDHLYLSTVAQFAARYYAECRDCNVLDRQSRSGLRTLLLSARVNARGGSMALRSSPEGLEVGNVDWGTPFATYVSDFRKLRGQPRAWFVFTSTWDDAETRLVLGCLGHRLDTIVRPRAVGYLYDLAASPDLGRGQCLGR